MRKVYYTKVIFLHISLHNMSSSKKSEKNYCGYVPFSEKWSRFPILCMCLLWNLCVWVCVLGYFLHIIFVSILLRVKMNEIILKGLCIKRSKIAQNILHGILPAHFYLLFTSSILLIPRVIKYENLSFLLIPLHLNFTKKKIQLLSMLRNFIWNFLEAKYWLLATPIEIIHFSTSKGDEEVLSHQMIL